MTLRMVQTVLQVNVLTTDGSGNLSFDTVTQTLSYFSSNESFHFNYNYIYCDTKITGGTGLATSLSGDTLTIDFDNNTNI